MRSLAIGIMSGTSLDGADAILADPEARPPNGIAAAFVPYPADLRARLIDLCAPGSGNLDAAGECALRLSEIYAIAVERVLVDAGVSSEVVRVIGCHGQTVRHRPELGYSIQLNNAARLAERTGIDVVTDFRSRDLAAGGQGAPLVPLFHDAVFRHESRHRAIVNIGGIGNISSLRPGRPVFGFDCGPGNVLMDTWTKCHLMQDYDESGEWAAQGRVLPALLDKFMGEPFVSAGPPKSTGRELFNEGWLRARLEEGLSPADVQATLLEFTARTIIAAADGFCGNPEEIFLCGGGARNDRLAARIGELAAPRPVRPTDALGVPAGHVEALAFAWLAVKCIRREKLDFTKVTGASHPCILGAVYPA